MSERDDAAAFVEHRQALLGLAYRILGSFAGAEDVVQEAWLRWSRADRSHVEEPKAYLLRVTATTALDHLRAASTSRENYVGPWLPEPVLTSPDAAEPVVLAESVSMAMLIVLETLSPLERVVFVLREAFGFDYAEIGAALDRSEPTVRQLAHRARKHVQARRPRFEPDPDDRRAATERFLRAATTGDLEALLEVLSPDVTLVADSGGKVQAPRRVISGASKVARFFAARSEAIPSGMRLRLTHVNGVPGAIATLDGAPLAVFLVDLAPSGRINGISLIGNPDKLTGVAGPA